MKIIVTNEQVHKGLTKFVNKYFDHFKSRKHKSYPDIIFFVNTNDEPMFQYDKSDKTLVVDLHKVMRKLRENFLFSDDDYKDFFKKWFEQTYGLKVENPQLYSTTSLRKLKKGEDK